MREKGLALFTVYDAFYCRLTDTEILKDIYFDVLIEVQQANPWQCFVYTNQIQANESDYISESERLKFNNKLMEMYQEVPNPVDLSKEKRGPNILN